jgi:hypothetical protein
MVTRHPVTPSAFAAMSLDARATLTALRRGDEPCRDAVVIL